MPLAAPALFGGAGLIVNHDRDAGDGRKVLLHLDEIVAVINRQARRPVGTARVFVRLVGDDDNALGALGRDLAGDLRNGEAAVIGLAAGHRDRVVEQDLVGDVGVGGDRRADRQIARVIVSAVAEILEYVLAGGKRSLANPIGAFAAHLRVAERRAGPSTAP